MPFLRQFLLILLVLCLVRNVNAQTLEDVVYVQNGSVYRGDILPDYPDSTVAIQILGGSIFVIPKSTVISITREVKLDPFKRKYAPRDTGYTVFASIGLLLGSNDWGFSGGALLDMINGYHFNQKLQAGIGLTLEASDDFYLTAYLDGRYNFNKKKNTPFIYGDLGIYTPLINKGNETWITDYDPGISAGFGLGIRLNPVKSKVGFITSLGYKISKYSITENDWWSGNPVEFAYTRQKFMFKIGFVY